MKNNRYLVRSIERAPFQTPGGPTLRVLKKLREVLHSRYLQRLDFLVFSADKDEEP